MNRTKRISVRIPEDMDSKLNAIKKKENLSLSDIVNLAIDKYIKKYNG